MWLSKLSVYLKCYQFSRSWSKYSLLPADDTRCQRHHCTVRDFVTKHLDINGIPRRYFWELMSQFTDDDLEREKLQEFCTAEGQACCTVILVDDVKLWELCTAEGQACCTFILVDDVKLWEFCTAEGQTHLVHTVNLVYVQMFKISDLRVLKLSWHLL